MPLTTFFTLWNVRGCTPPSVYGVYFSLALCSFPCVPYQLIMVWDFVPNHHKVYPLTHTISVQVSQKCAYSIHVYDLAFWATPLTANIYVCFVCTYTCRWGTWWKIKGEYKREMHTVLGENWAAEEICAEEKRESPLQWRDGLQEVSEQWFKEGKGGREGEKGERRRGKKEEMGRCDNDPMAILYTYMYMYKPLSDSKAILSTSYDALPHDVCQHWPVSVFVSAPC